MSLMEETTDGASAVRQPDARRPMAGWTGKTAFVTGGTSGIGREVARAFARAGASVVVAGRDRGRGEETLAQVREAGSDGMFVAMDVSRADAARAAFEAAAARFPRIDALVANAGMEQPHSRPLPELSDEELDQVVDTNLKGALRTVKHGLPLVPAPGGAVCLISSLWATLGGAGLSVYTATKGGIDALTRSLAVEHGPRGVRVNCVAPGAIQTPMLERYARGQDLSAFYKANVPLGRVGRPEEIAEAVVWLCSDAAAYVTGQVLGVDGGITIKMPVGA